MRSNEHVTGSEPETRSGAMSRTHAGGMAGDGPLAVPAPVAWLCVVIPSDQNISRTPSWNTRFELARTPLIEPKAGFVCTPVAKSNVATVFTP